MATNDLLQKLDGGADFGVTTSNRRQTEVFIAKEAVAVGDWVPFDPPSALLSHPSTPRWPAQPT